MRGAGGTRLSSQAVPAGSHSERAAFRFAATGCRGISLFITVDAEKAAAALPEPFSPFAAASGKALVVVRCFASGGLTIEDGLPVVAAVSELAIRIEAPGGTAGSHFYQLRRTTSGASLARRLQACGVDCDLSQFLTVEELELAPGEGLLVTTRPPQCSVTVRTAAPAPVEGGATEWIGWRSGPRGLVRERFLSVVSSGALAFGEICTGAESPLGRLIGGGASPSVGHWSRFDANATVSIVRGAAAPRSRPRAR